MIKTLWVILWQLMVDNYNVIVVASNDNESSRLS